jgi:hypothetical protein
MNLQINLTNHAYNMRFASKNTRMHRELVSRGEKIKRIAYLFQSYSFYFELFYTNY